MRGSPTAEEYCKYGISAAGLRHFYNAHGHASAGRCETGRHEYRTTPQRGGHD
jgi:hypothetical protein